MSDDPFIESLERDGYDTVCARLVSQVYAGGRRQKAEAWAAAETEKRRNATHVASLEVAGSARDAQWDAALSARESAASAQAANDLARNANASAEEANAIARTASDSAKRSADAARTSNTIAKAALVAAIIAIVVSIIGLTHNDAHDQTSPQTQAAQAHRR